MRIATGAGIAVILLFGMACKSSKHTSTSHAEELHRSEEQLIQAGASRRLDTDYLGDTLLGRVPLPYTVPRSANYQIKAGGINLDVTLQDSTLIYKAVAKPVARSTLIQEDTTFQRRKLDESSAVLIQEEKTKKKTGFPWWIWPILILVIVLAILFKINRIKLF